MTLRFKINTTNKIKHRLRTSLGDLSTRYHQQSELAPAYENGQ